MRLVMDVQDERERQIQRVLMQTKVVVSTIDAYLKYRAGAIKGYMGQLLDTLKPVIKVMDEVEAYTIQQVMASTLSSDVQTLLLLGDPNQRIETQMPSYIRTPWTPVGSQYAADNEDDEAGKPAMGNVPSTVHTRKNPSPRAFLEWISDFPQMQLTKCKRCGPKVCRHGQACFGSWASDFAADSCAPDTELWHVFYNGQGWINGPLELKGQVKQQLGWHNFLFLVLCLAVHADLLKYRHDNRMGPHEALPHPVVLVIAPLRRSAIPLAVVVQKIFGKGKGVKVTLQHSARGLSVPFVHTIRHRRAVGHRADQYHGIQRNLNFEYINLTRGKMKTTAWLEHEPFGFPGNEQYGTVDTRRHRVQDLHADYARKRNAFLMHSRQYGVMTAISARWCCPEELSRAYW